jgi:hypothetical protein
MQFLLLNLFLSLSVLGALVARVVALRLREEAILYSDP